MGNLRVINEVKNIIEMCRYSFASFDPTSNYFTIPSNNNVMYINYIFSYIFNSENDIIRSKCFPLCKANKDENSYESLTLPIDEKITHVFFLNAKPKPNQDNIKYIIMVTTEEGNVKIYESNVEI